MYILNENKFYPIINNILLFILINFLFLQNVNASVYGKDTVNILTVSSFNNNFWMFSSNENDVLFEGELPARASPYYMGAPYSAKLWGYNMMLSGSVPLPSGIKLDMSGNFIAAGQSATLQTNGQTRIDVSNKPYGASWSTGPIKIRILRNGQDSSLLSTVTQDLVITVYGAVTQNNRQWNEPIESGNTYYEYFSITIKKDVFKKRTCGLETEITPKNQTVYFKNISMNDLNENRKFTNTFSIKANKGACKEPLLVFIKFDPNDVKSKINTQSMSLGNGAMVQIKDTDNGQTIEWGKDNKLASLGINDQYATKTYETTVSKNPTAVVTTGDLSGILKYTITFK